ncbi:hypothetical protein RRG08_015310 [Elysia crispata]|uniref:Transmembrane protein n=1 Tax=Elysia crispata TaxID=231223 RepID=A0AAE0ZTQ4_9GAST|nr:hypothetical protein RRG08_015310 [Elysia crispata]
MVQRSRLPPVWSPVSGGAVGSNQACSLAKSRAVLTHISLYLNSRYMWYSSGPALMGSDSSEAPSRLIQQSGTRKCTQPADVTLHAPCVSKRPNRGSRYRKVVTCAVTGLIGMLMFSVLPGSARHGVRSRKGRWEGVGGLRYLVIGLSHFVCRFFAWVWVFERTRVE